MVAFSLATAASAQDSVNRIRSLDAVATVHADGSFGVVEALTVEMGGKSNEIVRELSLRGDSTRKGARQLDLTVLAVTDEDAQPLRVEETSIGSVWTRRLRIWIPGAGEKERRIEIRYRVANGIHFVDGGSSVGALDELRWRVTADVGGTPIDSIRARVVLPARARPTRSSVEIGSGASAGTDAVTRNNGNEISFVPQRALLPHEGMSVVVAWPFGHIHRQHTISRRERLVAALLWWPLLIPVIVFVLAFRAWDRKGRDPKGKSHVVRYEPVADVSPAGLGKLVSDTRSPHPRIVVATIVDLAIRGFLRIEETTPSILVTLTKDVRAIAQSVMRGESGSIDYIIHFVRGSTEWKGLKWHEVRLLHGLLSAAPSDGEKEAKRVRVSMLTSKFYTALPEIFEAVESELVLKGYYRENPGSVKLQWLFYSVMPFLIGLFADLAFDYEIEQTSTGNPGAAPFSQAALIISVFVSALILAFFAAIMPSRTVVGARAREAGLGFKEFLSRVQPLTSVELFERYLPFAIAFGVEKNWAHTFEGVYVLPPSWYSGPMGEFSATDFGNRISDLTISAAASMSSQPAEAGGRGFLLGR